MNFWAQEKPTSKFSTDKFSWSGWYIRHSNIQYLITASDIKFPANQQDREKRHENWIQVTKKVMPCWSFIGGFSQVAEISMLYSPGHHVTSHAPVSILIVASFTGASDQSLYLDRATFYPANIILCSSLQSIYLCTYYSSSHYPPPT